MYSWSIESIANSAKPGRAEQDVNRWLTDLYAPPSGRDPDRVSASVVNDEMAAFAEFSSQV